MGSDQPALAEAVSEAVANLPALLTIRRASEELGIPVGTLRRWIRSKQLRTMRVCGGHPRIPRTEIVRVLTEGAS